MNLGLSLSLGGMRVGGEPYGRLYEPGIITPPEAAPYGTYPFTAATKTEILPDPAWTGATKGPYWPCVLNKAEGQLPSDFPVDVLVYYSTDHASSGADERISVLLGKRNGAAATKFDWLDYDAALTAGWLDSYTGTKAAASPIFTGAETPFVWWEEATGLWHLYWHNSNSGSYWGVQVTKYVSSSSAFSFTASAVNALELPRTLTVGDGHSGYFRFGRNIFPDVPYAYVGYSLGGGTVNAFFAQWGSNSPAGPWTFIAQMPIPRGRVSEDMPANFLGEYNSIDPRYCRKHPLGFTMPMGFGLPSAGSTVVERRIFEALFDSTGRQLLARPIPVMSPSAATFSSSATQMPQIFDDPLNNRRCMAFLGQTSTLNGVGFAEADLRNPGNTQFVPFTDQTPATLSVDNAYDFVGANSLPAGLSETVAVVATHTWPGAGLQVDFSGTTAFDAPVSVVTAPGLNPSDYDFVDVLMDGLSSELADYNGNYFVGLKTTTALTLGDSIFAQSSGSSARTYLFSFTGTTRSAAIFDPVTTSLGLTYGTGVGQRRLTFGIRIFPATRKIFMLHQGGLETGGGTVTVGFDLNRTFFPFVAQAGRNDGLAVQTIMRGFKVRAG